MERGVERQAIACHLSLRGSLDRRICIVLACDRE